MSGSRLLVLYLVVLVAIVLVDYWLGPTAEYLNAYEIVRRTLWAGVPSGSAGFLYRGELFGQFTLPVAWLAFLLEGALVTGLLWKIGSSFAPGAK